MNLIPYQRAVRILKERFPDTTEEEAAIRVKVGELNVYDAYGKKFNLYSPGNPAFDVDRITLARFDEAELKCFDPEQGLGRWLTYAQLTKR